MSREICQDSIGGERDLNVKADFGATASGLETAENTQPSSDDETESELERQYGILFDEGDRHPPDLLDKGVPVDSLEAAVGYSSLLRQVHSAFLRRVAYYRSPQGGAMSIDEARSAAFHSCENREDARKLLSELMALPVDHLNFADLMELQEAAPRVAERYWERAKSEGRKEFESGHLSANISFPVGYMKQMWNIARYNGVRESFIDQWDPQGGVELSLIDMLTQTYFQWQFWLEQTVTRSQTKTHCEHPEYARWKSNRKTENAYHGFSEEQWFQPLVPEVQALEHAVKMAERWHRMFAQTLRQLQNLRPTFRSNEIAQTVAMPDCSLQIEIGILSGVD